MKLAYLVNQYPAISHTFIRREILELERRGHEIIRITIRKSLNELVDPMDQAEAQRTKVLLDTNLFLLFKSLIRSIMTNPSRPFFAFRTALRLNNVSDRSLLTHVAYLAEALLLSDFCRRHQLRHVHTHFGTNSAAVALLANCLSGISYSLTIHGPEEFDGPVALSLREKVSAASFVVAISHFGKAQLCRWVNPDQWHKIHVIGCTVDHEFFKESGPVPKNADGLVCVGRLSAQKGQLMLIEAFARTVKEGKQLKLILAGDGELRQILESSIQKHQLDENVEITGWVSGETVRKLLLKSRCFILPSFAEGLPVVIMEAMAIGRPIISTFVAGIPELVHHGTSGWLVPAGDVDALANAIRELAEASHEELTAMGRRGTEAVRASHALCTEIDKLESCLKGLC